MIYLVADPVSDSWALYYQRKTEVAPFAIYDYYSENDRKFDLIVPLFRTYLPHVSRCIKLETDIEVSSPSELKERLGQRGILLSLDICTSWMKRLNDVIHLPETDNILSPIVDNAALDSLK